MHVLCNNAGVFQGGLTWECSTADFEWTLGVNLWGILHAAQSFVPRMLEQGQDAHIVNTVSMAGLATTAYSRALRGVEVRGCRRHRVPGARPRLPGRADQGVVAVPRERRHRDRPLAPQPSRAVRGRADPGAAFVEEALAGTTAAGAHPDAVAEMVLEAIHEETFLVPTTPSYRTQILDARDALADRNLPPSVGLRLTAGQYGRARFSRNALMPSCASASPALAAITRFARSYAASSSTSIWS